jgi:Spy/CpxP family protein refolding chaperone
LTIEATIENPEVHESRNGSSITDQNPEKTRAHKYTHKQQ